MAMSQAGRGGRRTSDFGFPSARSTVGRRSGSPPKPRPSGLFGGDAAYNTANPPPVGRVPSHGDRFAESLRDFVLIVRRRPSRSVVARAKLKSLSMKQMIMNRITTVMCVATSALALSFLLVGCAHEVSHTESSRVSSND
jgi:hypothetical protein